MARKSNRRPDSFEISPEKVQELKQKAEERTLEMFVEDHEELAKRIAAYRVWKPHHLIGFVPGTWDMLHLGHLKYIQIARLCVDLLVLGVDTDELARNRKGTDGIDRPVVLFEERWRILDHVRHVDLITPVVKPKESNKPVVSYMMPILELIKPDVLVLSKTTGDLPKDKEAEYAEYQKHVRCILMLEPQAPPEQVSTTARIRNLLRQGLNHAEVNLKASIEESITDKFEELRSKL